MFPSRLFAEHPHTSFSLTTSLAALVLPWKAWTLFYLADICWVWLCPGTVQSTEKWPPGCGLWVWPGRPWLSIHPPGGCHANLSADRWTEGCFSWVTYYKYVLPFSTCEGGFSHTRPRSLEPIRPVKHGLAKLVPSRCVLSTMSASLE